MVAEGQKYVEQGIGAYEKRRLNRKFAHLDRQAQNLGIIADSHIFRLHPASKIPIL